MNKKIDRKINKDYKQYKYFEERILENVTSLKDKLKILPIFSVGGFIISGGGHYIANIVKAQHEALIQCESVLQDYISSFARRVNLICPPAHVTNDVLTFRKQFDQLYHDATTIDGAKGEVAVDVFGINVPVKQGFENFAINYDKMSRELNDHVQGVVSEKIDMSQCLISSIMPGIAGAVVASLLFCSVPLGKTVYYKYKTKKLLKQNPEIAKDDDVVDYREL